MHYDFSKTATDQLKRSLRFHENDRGTMTMEEECRRMYLCQEIAAEIQRRQAALKPGERGFNPGCGCCVGPEDDRCVCHIHQDIPRGHPARKCSLHREG